MIVIEETCIHLMQMTKLSQDNSSNYNYPNTTLLLFIRIFMFCQFFNFSMFANNIISGTVLWCLKKINGEFF